MYKIKREAFTLFELLIVLIIISAVYYLVVPTTLFRKASRKNFEFKELKSYLATFSKSDRVTLLCTDECRKCKVYDTNKTISVNILKNRRVEAYEYKDGYLDKLHFQAPKLVDTYEEICFKYSYYPKKDVGDELFARYGDKIYYFSPYFQDTKIFDSLDDAREYYEKNLKRLRD